MKKVVKLKTREIIKDIKVFDRAANVTTHMKNAYIKSKDSAEQTQEPGYDTPEGYATDTASGITRDITDKVLVRKSSVKIRAKQSGSRTIDKSDTKYPSITNQTKNDFWNKASHARFVSNRVPDTDMKVKPLTKSINTHKSKIIKTSHQSSRATESITRTTAIDKHKKAREISRKSSRTGKSITKATVSTIKAIAASLKALISAIAAGGWIAVILIVVICIIGLVIGSCFGIFFSNEGEGHSMRIILNEINTDYVNCLEEAKSAYDYDVLEISNRQVIWKEILAFYAVKETTDSRNPREVATIDSSKTELLKSIFWEMNEIYSSTETKTETQVFESDDGHGNIVETVETITRTYLFITVKHKTAWEMADIYYFNINQRGQLAELLEDKYNSMWEAVLHGFNTLNDEIVAVALSQVGYSGGQEYWYWYGFNSRVDWCACFVSWCANECGLIDAGIIPKFAGCITGSEWFKARGQWRENNYAPSPGDIVFFDWDGDEKPDHTGIVVKTEDGKIYTIEGNADDSCKQNSYNTACNEIYGYGVPAY